MDSRYLKLGPQEAIWIKDHIRSSKDSFENILRHMLAYQLLRKKEIMIKSKLKLSLSQLRSKLNSIESNFPEEERKDIYEQIYQKEKYNKKSKRNSDEFHQEIPMRLMHLHSLINKEKITNRDKDLEDIKKKLEKLNK